MVEHLNEGAEPLVVARMVKDNAPLLVGPLMGAQPSTEELHIIGKCLTKGARIDDAAHIRDVKPFGCRRDGDDALDLGDTIGFAELFNNGFALCGAHFVGVGCCGDASKRKGIDQSGYVGHTDG